EVWGREFTIPPRTHYGSFPLRPATPKHASSRDAAVILDSTADGKEAIDAWRRQGNPSRSPLPTPPAIATDQVEDRDIEELERSYRECGFLDVRVCCFRTIRDGEEVTVVYRVHEGPRYRVKKEFTLADLRESVRLASALSFLVGESQSPRPDQPSVTEEIERLKRWAAVWGGTAEVKTTWVKSAEQPATATVRFEVRFIGPGGLYQLMF